MAEIKQLKKEDMETYRKSILEYHDVRLVADCARDEGRKEGRDEEKITIAKKCLQMDIPVEVIVELTGYTEKQINYYAENGTL